MTDTSTEADIEIFFSGQKLYGNDFSTEQLERWYEEEAEGYSGIIKETRSPYSYVYHELNKIHGFRHVKLPSYCRALGIGSAYCEEFLPILPHLSHITSLDPSYEFSLEKFGNVPVSHQRPSIDGSMPFPDDHFDIVTCFGVLHHIANVSFVLEECHRVLKPDGIMFCREPIVTMGDWRQPRRGATKNERGIPYNLLIEMVEKQNFSIVRLTLFDFAPLGRLLRLVGIGTFANKTTTILDRLFSQLFSFNKKYHRVGLLDKFGPASVYLVLHKKASVTKP